MLARKLQFPLPLPLQARMTDTSGTAGQVQEQAATQGQTTPPTAELR